MGKGKLEKFAELEAFPNVFQYPYSVIAERPFEMKGRWRIDFFKNENPIVLELGCGKGEYAVALARQCPDVNFIGVDIKGARLWTGASQAIREGLPNVAFLRTNIEFIDHFFSPDEVQEIWLTFSDPQMKNPRKRLTSTYFLERYRRFLINRGIIHLKTDSNFLFTYTDFLVKENRLPPPTSITTNSSPKSLSSASRPTTSRCGSSAACPSNTCSSSCHTMENSSSPTWKSSSTNTVATIAASAVARSGRSNCF